MKYFPLFLIITFLILPSCKEEITAGFVSDYTDLVIPLDSANSHFSSLCDEIDEVNLVTLETNDSSLLSNSAFIGEIIPHDGKIFILDTKFMAIKVFDMSGAYLYSIGQLGIGRGGFTNVQDMTLNKWKNTLLVLCNTPSKIIEFDLTGKLIKETKLEFWASKIAYQTSNQVCFYVNQNESNISEENNILITDSNFSVRKRFFPFPKNVKSSVAFSGGLRETNGKIYYAPPFGNTFYLLSNDSATAICRVDFGNKNIPANISEDSLFRTLNKYGFQYGNFVAAGNYIGFNYLSNIKKLAFFDLKKSTLILNDPGKDSLNMIFSNSSIFEFQGKLMLLLDKELVSKWLDANPELVQNKFPQLYSSILSISPGDNPGIMFFSLKSNEK